jgi:hypothetical protein
MRANIMDYSLLLGAHNQTVAVPALGGGGSACGVGGSAGGGGGGGGSAGGGGGGGGGSAGELIAEAVDVPRYYLGIIDVLQQWDWSKRVERWTKIIVKKR